MVSAPPRHSGGPRRALRRGLIIAVVALALLAVAAVAAFALRGGADRLGIDTGPDPKATVRVFSQAWVAGDYRTMYKQLTPADRARIRYRAFRRSYLHSASVATLEHVRADGPTRVVDGIASVPVVMRTSEFGRLHGLLSLPLVRAGDAYRIDWSQQLTWPGLAAGERLVRSSQVPSRRGAILASDRSALARGPADAREYPQGAPYYRLTGFLDAPQTPAERRRRVAEGWPGAAKYGQGGLEQSLDDVLSGVPRIDLKAVGGGADRLIARHPGRRPRDVETTLDPDLQATATAALGSREGGIVIMDARNGAVRAAAGLGMDGRQPPGSTFKIITASAALAAGKADLDSYYEPARYGMVGGFKLVNFHHELCGGSLIDAFAHSCNSVFGPLAVDTGAKHMVDTANAFGFNTVPHIRYPAPVSLMPRPAQLTSPVNLGVSGIGQGGVSATPLEMAQVAQVIAAHGQLRPAWLARKPHRQDDRSKPRRVISRAVAAKVATMMRAVVAYGTGTAAASSLATVNGKTGTAELGPGIRSDAWFVGYAPAEAPRVVVSVLIVHGGVGGKTAAPIARAMIDAALSQ